MLIVKLLYLTFFVSLLLINFMLLISKLSIKQIYFLNLFKRFLIKLKTNFKISKFDILFAYNSTIKTYLIFYNENYHFYYNTIHVYKLLNNYTLELQFLTRKLKTLNFWTKCYLTSTKFLNLRGIKFGQKIPSSY